MLVKRIPCTTPPPVLITELAQHAQFGATQHKQVIDMLGWVQEAGIKVTRHMIQHVLC